MTPLESVNPFAAMLGEQWSAVSPLVRRHFLQNGGRLRYRGVMTRVWRREGWRGALAAPFLALGSLTQTLFAATGRNVPFVVENCVSRRGDGRMTMTWRRRFDFPRRPFIFDAEMHYDPARRLLIDRLGSTRHLEVELSATVRDGGVDIQSHRQWLRLGRLRLGVPRWIAGRARVREWQRSDGMLAIRVVVDNPILGEFFGYEGTFGPLPMSEEL
ncbi:MAG: DUF4166 domain-containing protein [Phycisphaeraceae bacterium]